VPPAVASALPQRRHIRRDIAGLVAGQFMFGILACGSRRNVIRPFSLKFGRLAISSNGGAPAFASRCVLVTTWQDAHQRCASRSPLEGSAPNAGCAMAAINIAKAAALIDGDVVVFIAEPHVAGRQKKHTAKRCRNEKSQIGCFHRSAELPMTMPRASHSRLLYNGTARFLLAAPASGLTVSQLRLRNCAANSARSGADNSAKMAPFPRSSH
jgi:hypothetical protein